jgi:hypothetical protein
MYWRKWLIAISFSFLVTVLSVQTAYAEKKSCTSEESRRALDQADTLRSWDALYRSYKTFGNCDDGAVGEGFSESVARILVEHWNTLSRLAQIAKKDGAFREFVIRHVDGTLNMDDVEKIKKDARKQCPTEQQTICMDLAKQADYALKLASSP